MGSLATASVLLGLVALRPVETTFLRLTGGEPSHVPGTLLLVSLISIAGAFVIVEVLRRREALLGFALPRPLQAAAADWFGLLFAARRGVAAPVFRLARLLRRLDDELIDVGVWGAAGSALRAARRAASFDEHVVDALVVAVARLGTLSAALSRLWDDVVIDGAVEGVGRLSAGAGQNARRLQNGMAHDYYITIAAGLAVAIVLAATT
jgi:NADH-quinone oxidoreductase subunit L